MPRYGNRPSFFFRRYISPYWIIDMLINVGIIAILIMLFFVAMPYIILLSLLIGGKYFVRRGFPRRYYRREW